MECEENSNEYKASGTSDTECDSVSPQPLDWRRAHEALSRLAATRAALDWEEGRSLLYALRAGAHVHLGFGTFAEYVERMLGYTARWTHERLRVAEALEQLPELAQSLRDASLSWSAVRELVRVATRENEGDWIAAVHNCSVRQIEELVSGHKLGDRPNAPKDDKLRRHILRFEISGDVLATWREAEAKVRRDADGPLDDDATLVLIARHALGGPTDAGRATYQIAMTLCGQCGRGWQQGRGELVEVGSEVVEMAGCDGQHIGSVAKQTKTDVDAPTHLGTETPVHAPTHVGTVQTHPNGPRPPCTGLERAHQDVRPRIRREVLRRDGGRCVVPGCANAVFVDVHHVDLRSEGGSHAPDNLVTVCCAHHRALHRGELIVEGKVSAGLTFRHADGSLYGRRLSPIEADAHRKVFSALRGMGFREGEARRALERVREETHVGTEGLLRAALAVLA